jgi:hypothetical protein
MRKASRVPKPILKRENQARPVIPDVASIAPDDLVDFELPRERYCHLR